MYCVLCQLAWDPATDRRSGKASANGANEKLASCVAKKQMLHISCSREYVLRGSNRKMPSQNREGIFLQRVFQLARRAAAGSICSSRSG